MTIRDDDIAGRLELHVCADEDQRHTAIDESEPTARGSAKTRVRGSAKTRARGSANTRARVSPKTMATRRGKFSIGNHGQTGIGAVYAVLAPSLHQARAMKRDTLAFQPLSARFGMNGRS